MAVGPALEAAARPVLIGSSLDAELDLYCDDGLLKTLERLGEELRFVLIVSQARLHPLCERPADAPETELAGLAVQVSACAQPKCVRRWHHGPMSVPMLGIRSSAGGAWRMWQGRESCGGSA